MTKTYLFRDMESAKELYGENLAISVLVVIDNKVGKRHVAAAEFFNGDMRPSRRVATQWVDAKDIIEA